MKYLAPLALAAFVPILLAAGSKAGGNVKAGETLFKQRCMMCHAVTPGAKAVTAPNLRGLAGTVSGTGDFKFTPALKKAKIVWTKKTLDQFLAAPSERVPGTLMTTAVPDPKQRADITAYLLSLE